MHFKRRFEAIDRKQTASLTLSLVGDQPRDVPGEPVQHPAVRGGAQRGPAAQARRPGQVGHRARRRQRFLQPQQERYR